jgi:sugar phosphate isomerase/epimerase
MMKLGFSTWAMPKLPIDAALEHIAATGYTGVEITVHKGWSTELERLDAAERRRIRTKVTDHDLDLPALTCPGTLVGEPEQVAASISRVKDAIDLAVDWAAGSQPPIVVTIPGGRPEDWENQAKRAQLVESAGELARYAEQAGVLFAFEAHVLQIVERPEQQLWVMEQVGSPALKANFDISHFEVVGIPTEESVAALVPGGVSVHTHLKDQRGLSPNHEYLIPGEGDFDYVRYLKAMAGAGYDAYIVPEISIMVQRRADYDPLATATRSYEVLDRAFRAAGIERQRREAKSAKMA